MFMVFVLDKSLDLLNTNPLEILRYLKPFSNLFKISYTFLAYFIKANSCVVKI